MIFSFTAYFMRGGCMYFETNGADVLYSLDYIDQLTMQHVRENFPKSKMSFNMTMAAEFMVQPAPIM